MKESVRTFKIKNVKADNNKLTLKSTAYADNKEENLLFAYVTNGRYIIETSGNSVVTLVPKTGDEKPIWGINNLTVYLVPEGTYESNRIRLEELKTTWDNAQPEAKESAEKAFADAIQKYGIKVTIKVELPSLGNRAYAEEVISLVNKERNKVGLSSLSMDEDVMYAAYVRAKELVNKFSHTRPDGTSCFTVLDENMIYYTAAGENIAMGYPTSKSVMNGWMNSSGHKANVLNKWYTHIGVGCYEVDGYYYWVQLFINKTGTYQ